MLREENGLRVERRIVWKRKGESRKSRGENCLNSESVIWTVSSAIT
jgi:hypothetical protein